MPSSAKFCFSDPLYVIQDLPLITHHHHHIKWWLYGSSPLICGDMSQGAQWVAETSDGTGPYIYYVFS